MEQANPLTCMVNDTVIGRISEEVILVIQPEIWLLTARARIDNMAGGMSAEAIAGARKRFCPTPEDKVERAVAARTGWEDGHLQNRAGVSWSKAEWVDLEHNFDSGDGLDELCEKHGRSSGAILAALVKLTLLTKDRQGTYRMKDGNAWGGE